MMKWYIAISLLLWHTGISAKQNPCWLTEEKHVNTGAPVIYCGTHAPTHVPITCRIPDNPRGYLGDEIKVEKVKIPDANQPEPDLIDRVLAFVGIKELAEDEMIVCTLDTAKREARLDADRAAQEAEEAVREAKRVDTENKKTAMLNACRGVVSGTLKPICEYLQIKEE